jgi:hypothetical protein
LVARYQDVIRLISNIFMDRRTEFIQDLSKIFAGAAIDLPSKFDSNDAAWTTKGKIYGEIIPEAQSPGWLISDAYRDHCELWTGDAKALLPRMVDKVDSIDLFYHDSDHTYDHMIFEFREAKRKLKFGGLLVGDDVS